MNDYTFFAFLLTAAAVGVMHTVLGPDHYVPFIAMSKAGGWSRRKTLRVTWLCGAAHVLSSVALGIFGVWGVNRFGMDLERLLARLTGIESARGNIVGWMLIGFGLAYTAWGVRMAIRNRPHAHWPIGPNGPEPDGDLSSNASVPTCETPIRPPAADVRSVMTGWALFTIFVFGPCEPLIPLMMAPAAMASWTRAALVALVFGVATVGTMTAMVLAGAWGVSALRAPSLQRYAHAAAGAALVACGAAVQLGL